MNAESFRRGFEHASRWWPLLLSVLVVADARGADPVAVDLSGYAKPDDDDRARPGVTVEREGPRLVLTWPTGLNQRARMSIDLRPGEPLFQRIALLDGEPLEPPPALLDEVDPVVRVTVGSRENPPGRPPEMNEFNVFFDSPAKRPHASHVSRLNLKSARVVGGPARATVILDGLEIGPFHGAFHVTVFARTPLIQVEAVVATQEEKRAFVYDAGLVTRWPDWSRFAWRDTEGKLQFTRVDPDGPDTRKAVRHRALAVETRGGSVAVFPPPHQYFYPRDLTDNQETTWWGRDHGGKAGAFGFGIRQSETGGGAFVPWFNAPPGTYQRMCVFYLMHHNRAAAVLDDALRFTNGDRFPDLGGHVRMSSHWHMATAMAAMAEIAAGKPRGTPDFVRMFKDMNIDIVHLAEFHGDGHPQDPGPRRLPEMKAMFDECRRLSDTEILFLPGEEANVHLGVKGPGQHPGHWLYLFPRPVYWTMTRAPGQPFEERMPGYGTVYHVGDREDMFRLIRDQRGLAWTAHPRIKASNWAPDAYRDHDYFRDASWLGAAWKAMPADLSRPRLGERVLDLLDDMANWGVRKYVLGEVDVFKIDHAHELYGHMNVNYVRLDRVPSFDDDWTPVLDALKHGRFFVTTGEVLLAECTIGGKSSGETLRLPPDGRPTVRLDLRSTFPLSFAEVISGDGSRVYRDRIDLSTTLAFRPIERELRPMLAGRKWARVEVWDVAANGAFSQPVWLEPASAP